MISIKINNNQTDAYEGETILETARRAGYYIPTLCHSNGIAHYTSCMVCMVKENRSGNFLPSCSAIVSENMEIDIESDAVLDLRKKAVELLLSEHRADCEAPCRIVCPASYDIPLMNRLLSGGDLENARKLSHKQLNTTDIWCFHCPGYCENACRRKKIDIPVSIKNLQIFVSGASGPVEKDPLKPQKGKKRFMSLAGKIEGSELSEWLKETGRDKSRHREIALISDAGEEAASCMHCDCRAAEDCRLRDLGKEMDIRDPRGKIVNTAATKKINLQTNLIFENAKCIKCGLCVRICEDKEDEPALCFINRGFVSIISEPLTVDFSEILKKRTADCINICPTGALSWFKNNHEDETGM
jgi:predicted molibdopterin-dependent oxidoreductase YjgC